MKAEQHERRSTVEFVLARFAFVGVLSWFIVTSTHPEGMCDYLWPYKASVALMQSGNPFESPGYLYPPFFAGALVPYALFPWKISAVLWQLTTLLAWFGCVYRVWRLLFPEGSWSKLLAVAGAGMLFVPLSHSMFLGQPSALMTLMLLEAYERLRHQDGALGGVLIGLAAGIKLFPGLLVVPLILTKRFKAAGALMATLLATLAAFPSQTLMFVQIQLTGSSGMPAASGHYVSLPSVISRLLVQTPYSEPMLNAPLLAKAIILVVSGTVVMLTIAKTWKTRDFTHGYTLAVVAMMLASPGVGFYHMDLPLIFTVIWFHAQPTRPWWRPLAVATVLLALPQRFGIDRLEFLNIGAGNLFRSPGTFGLLILFAWLLWWQPNPELGLASED